MLLLQPRPFPGYVAREEVFLPDECAEIVRLATSRPSEPARVKQKVGDKVGVARSEPTHRQGEVTFLAQDGETGWIYERICQHALAANADWGFALSGCGEPLQYTVYQPNDHYDWHMDLGPDRASIRKLSVTIQLSDPDAYVGSKTASSIRLSDFQRS